MALRACVKQCGPFIQVSADGVVPLPPQITSALERPLFYNHVVFHFGAGQYSPDSGARHGVTTQPRRLFQYDSNGHFVCQKGFYPKIRSILVQHGFTVDYIDLDEPKDERIYQANWDRIFERFELRPRQDECLAQIDMHNYGIIDAPPAFGKTHIMGMVCSMYPRAKIDIVTKRKDVVARIRGLLTKWVPSVGQVGGGLKKEGRVTVYTADSLQHSNFTADILLADECHELMTDRLAEQLGRYWTSRNYGFSATTDCRLDNAHYRMEGLFGPKIFEMSQQEAEALGLVSPVFVQWFDVNPGCNPAQNIKSLVARKRNGIWRNQWRNQVIAEASRSFVESGNQVLILVDTVDHALHLRKLLPEATLCYSEGTWSTSEDRAEKREFYIRHGLLADDEVMTTALRNTLRQQFETRQLMLVIATGVWAVGVSFDSLNVLVRADGGASETANIQLPGRVCRVDPASGKECGIVLDFNDIWDPGFRDRSGERRLDYNKRGWTQILSNGKVWTPGSRTNRATL